MEIKKMHFAGQKENEEILLTVRRHWFNILSQFIIVLGMVIVILLGFFIKPYLPFTQSIIAARGIYNLIEIFFLMLVWIMAFFIWIDYYFDVWIVTDKRIVNIEQRGLFKRDISELELVRIQDVTAEIVGIIPTLLDYGEVQIQTAGEMEHFLFRKVPHPNQIKDLIMNLKKKEIAEESDELGEMIQQKIHEEMH
ncbi:MAG: PH domain-containing protein [Candidatus Moranbacteria bacterium]|nr:PH domain-containing protein [Candidatus Moranbacteria bacterium]